MIEDQEYTLSGPYKENEFQLIIIKLFEINNNKTRV